MYRYIYIYTYTYYSNPQKDQTSNPIGFGTVYCYSPWWCEKQHLQGIPLVAPGAVKILGYDVDPKKTA